MVGQAQAMMELVFPDPFLKSDGAGGWERKDGERARDSLKDRSSLEWQQIKIKNNYFRKKKTTKRSINLKSLLLLLLLLLIMISM